MLLCMTILSGQLHDGSVAAHTTRRDVQSLCMKSLDGCKVPVGSSVQWRFYHTGVSVVREAERKLM
jgi:hypothetical protein